jgi:hypothetical protein
MGRRWPCGGRKNAEGKRVGVLVRPDLRRERDSSRACRRQSGNRTGSRSVSATASVPVLLPLATILPPIVAVQRI